jgi:hypothetical protein
MVRSAGTGMLTRIAQGGGLTHMLSICVAVAVVAYMFYMHKSLMQVRFMVGALSQQMANLHAATQTKQLGRALTSVFNVNGQSIIDRINHQVIDQVIDQVNDQVNDYDFNGSYDDGNDNGNADGNEDGNDEYDEHDDTCIREMLIAAVDQGSMPLRTRSGIVEIRMATGGNPFLSHPTPAIIEEMDDDVNVNVSENNAGVNNAGVNNAGEEDDAEDDPMPTPEREQEDDAPEQDKVAPLSNPLSEVAAKSMRVEELRRMLRERSLDHRGSKDVLVERLLSSQ